MRRRSSFLWRALRIVEVGLVAASLVLLVFVIVLAIETWRTPWRDPRHSVSFGDSAVFVDSSAFFGSIQDQKTFEAGLILVWDRDAYSGSRPLETNVGPAYLIAGWSRGHVGLFVTMPFWLAGVLGGLGPAYIVVRFLTRRRPRPCDCRACGYDLTGNASGVCPECGTPVKPEEG